jgi:hypothetical protein
MKKAQQVFARLGFSDMIVPLENSEEIYSSTETYLVGYEDEEGEECEEDGTYLDQNKMKKIEGINIHNLEVTIDRKVESGNMNIGALTLEIEDRAFILDVVQTYHDDIEGNKTRVTCELEVDEDTFFECPYNVTKEDILNARHNNLKRTLYIDGEVDFEVELIILHFDDCNGQDYQIEVVEE